VVEVVLVVLVQMEQELLHLVVQVFNFLQLSEIQIQAQDWEEQDQQVLQLQMVLTPQVSSGLLVEVVLVEIIPEAGQ
tara:strand:+ start:337 stop:567 length:231 start_codon:yes stop_codon:yes gene_type:complete